MPNWNEVMGRNAIDLTPEQYMALEKKLIVSARRPRIARKAYGTTVGPFGFGKMEYDYDKITDMEAALISMVLEEHEDAINIGRTQLNIPILQKGFFIEARRLEASKLAGTPLNVSNGANAAYKVGIKEEGFLFQGWAPNGSTYTISGAYQASGVAEATNKDFGTAGNAIDKAQLVQAAFAAQQMYPPFDWVLHPTQFAQLSLYTANHNRSNRTEVEEIIQGTINQSVSITAATGLAMTAGRGGELYDIVIGQDFVTKFKERGFRGLDFICYETMVPVIYDEYFGCKMTTI